MRDNKGGDAPRLKPTPSNDDLNKEINVPENWLYLILTKYWWVFATAFMVSFAVAMIIFYNILGSLQSNISCLRYELEHDVNRQIDELKHDIDRQIDLLQDINMEIDLLRGR